MPPPLPGGGRAPPGPPRAAPGAPRAAPGPPPAGGAPPPGLSKMQLMAWKKRQAATQPAPPSAPAPAPSAPAPPQPEPEPQPQPSAAPPGMSKLQAMAWQRRAAHKRRALLKVKALIFMTGARGLAAAEANGGVVPRAVLAPPAPAPAAAAAAGPSDVLSRLAAKRGLTRRRLWVKVRSLLAIMGAAGLRQRCAAADTATKLVAPPGLGAKERIRWRGERKANIRRAWVKLRAVIAIAGAAGLRDPNEPPPDLTPMEKLKWKAARAEQQASGPPEGVPPAGERRGRSAMDSSIRTSSWSDSRLSARVPDTLSRVLGHRSPSPGRESVSPRRSPPSPEVGPARARGDGSPRGLTGPAPRQPSPLGAGPSARLDLPPSVPPPSPLFADAAGGDEETGRYQSGLGLVSEHVATLQMERAVLAVRSDSVAAQQLRIVEGELRATLAAISCAFLLPALSARLPALIACCCRLARQQLDRVKRKRGR